jgi:hypothetical protein
LIVKFERNREQGASEEKMGKDQEEWYQKVMKTQEKQRNSAGFFIYFSYAY